MNAVLLLLVGTVLLGTVVFALRESSILAAVIAALGMMVLGIFVLVAPIESPADILGFPLWKAPHSHQRC